MRLAYKKLPLVLRLLNWLFLIHGCLRVVLVLVGQFAEEPPPLSSLGFPIVYVWSAIRVRQGLREGVSWLLFTVVAQFVFLVWFVLRGTLAPDIPVVLAAAWLVATGGYLAWARLRLPWREPGSYGDWISNPEAAQGVAGFFAARDRLLQQDREQPPDPDSMVAGLLDGDGVEMIRQRLLAQPEHFGMAVFRALGDPAFRRNPEALAMLIGQLPESLLARSGPRLSACLPHVEADQRRRVLQLMAASGDPELGSTLAGELLGEHGDYVARGLDDAAKSGRLGDELFAELEPSLWRCLEAENACAPASLVLLSRRPDLPRQLAEQARDLDETSLRALVAIAEAGQSVPGEQLLGLWRTARDRGAWYWCWRLQEFADVPEDDLRDLLARAPAYFGDEAAMRLWTRESAARYSRLAFVRALAKLCQRGVVDAEQLLREAIAMELQEVSDEAARMLGERLTAPQDWSFGGRGTTHRQRMLATLSVATSFACNGGLEHAFMCLDEEDMQVLKPALDEIVPTAVRDIWMAAMHEIAPDEDLPVDSSARQAAIGSRYDQIEQRLEELNSAFFACQWRQTVAMHLYAIEHQDELRSGSAE
ncbi:MAG: hypothetical protein ACE37K_15365 [Planctomycetota bacterium]